MDYKIGEVYDFAGQQRKVLSFDAAGLPVTTQDLKAQVSCSVHADEVALRAQLQAEYDEKRLQERAQAQAHTRALLLLLPLDKCTHEQLLKLAAHLGLSPAPESDKAALIAQILAV